MKALESALVGGIFHEHFLLDLLYGWQYLLSFY